MENFVIFFAVFFSGSVFIQGCNIKYIAVGCYKDDDKRPLPEQVFNERDKSSLVYNGHSIDWGNWEQYMRDLACRCAQKTQSMGNRVFGLQFYGECWTGPDINSYESVGEAGYDRCVGDNYGNCSRFCSHCVGKQNTNFVYIISKDTYYPKK